MALPCPPCLVQKLFRSADFDRQLAAMFYGPSISVEDKLRMYRFLRVEELLAVYTATTMFLRHDLDRGNIDAAFETVQVLLL